MEHGLAEKEFTDCQAIKTTNQFRVEIALYRMSHAVNICVLWLKYYQ